MFVQTNQILSLVCLLCEYPDFQQASLKLAYHVT